MVSVSGGVLNVLVVSVLLLVATFIIGLLPLFWLSRKGLNLKDINNDSGILEDDELLDHRQETYIQVMSHFGVGMLLGTSFMLVIPEGVNECLANDGNVGLNLLIGYLIVYILDRFTGLLLNRDELSTNNQYPGSIIDPTYSIELASWKDIFKNPKQVVLNIVKNNVVFALCIHGLSDGVALGSTVNNQSVLMVMLLAIVIHKIPAVLSLSSLMISRQNLSKWEVIVNLFAFASSTPIGYIIVSLFNLKQSETINWLSGNLLLMSGGSLLYAAFTAFSSSDEEHGHIHISDMYGSPSNNNTTSNNDYKDDNIPMDELVGVRSYKIVRNQSAPQSNDDDNSRLYNYNQAEGTSINNYSKLKYDKSVYILCGVILPVVISFIIRE